MKDIKNYEGLYAITEDGRVWGYKRNKFLKPKTRANGYLEVNLCKGGKTKSHLVHRLVAEAYIPNPNKLPQVSHLDETRNNNNVNNLTWASAKDNCNMPKHKKRKSESHSKAVLCVETNIIYPSMIEAARNMGCTSANISKACRQLNGKACGYHWRYVDESILAG